MYPAELTQPMKAELTNHGFQDLTSSEHVNNLLTPDSETVFVVINSVCGCAAANARPAALLAVEHSSKKPKQMGTVFAGVDRDAVNRVREMSLPFPPSSPSMGLFKNGRLVHFIERHQIEGVSAQAIAQNLIQAFETHC